MSRKKIVAATSIAAALGLAFAGYSATRANGTEDFPRPAKPLPVKADAGYRQNHQIEHNGAVFEWMDVAASLDRSTVLPGRDDEPVRGKDLVAGANENEELEPVAVEHAERVGSGWAGYGLAGGGGGGGTPKNGDEWSGGRYASAFAFGFGGGMGSFGGGGGGSGSSDNSKGTSGSNDPAGDKPHQDTPAGSNGNKDDKPGTGDPKAGDPPATGPTNQDPPSGEQNQNPPGGSNDGHQNDGDHHNGGGNHHHDGDHPHNGGDHPNGGHNPPHSVPEPATFGLLGFGIVAAAALRRRRRD
jgi:hypothetical protein